MINNKISRTSKAKGSLDYFKTPQYACELFALFVHKELPSLLNTDIIDLSAGDGCLTKPFLSLGGYTLDNYDIEPKDPSVKYGDFEKSLDFIEPMRDGEHKSIVSNPPYNKVNKYIKICIDLIHNGCIDSAFLLCNATILHSLTRYNIYKKHSYYKVLSIVNRIDFKEGSSSNVDNVVICFNKCKQPTAIIEMAYWDKNFKLNVEVEEV